MTSIEMITEEVHYYHVVSSQYYNIIANNIITTDGAVYLSNLYGFDENIKWPAIRDEVMSDPDNLYTYEDFEDIGMPRKMFDDLRVQEAKYLAVTYGITLDVFKGYLLSNQLNTDIWLNYCEGSVKLREEYCPAEPEETIQGNVTESNTQGKAQTSSVENEIENSDEFDTEDGYEEPLGETTRAGDVNESTTGGLTIEGVLVESLVIAGAIGSFYLATRDRSRDKKK